MDSQSGSIVPYNSNASNILYSNEFINRLMEFNYNDGISLLSKLSEPQLKELFDKSPELKEKFGSYFERS